MKAAMAEESSCFLGAYKNVDLSIVRALSGLNKYINNKTPSR